MKKLSFLAIAAFLTACGTATTADFGTYKEITFEGFTQSPYQGEVRATMETLSMKECPNGYEILNQSQSAKPRRVVWKIRCSK